MFDSRPDWFGLDPGFVWLMGTWTTAAVCVTFSRPHFDVSATPTWIIAARAIDSEVMRSAPAA